METLNREDILRMIGLRDSAGLFSKINSLMIDMYDEGGKLAEYSTQIVQTEKNITLLAQRVTDNEQDIADLTVTAQQISATVEHQQDEIDEIDGTVSGHTTQIGQLQVTAQEISASVSSLTTTVNGHTSQISTLRTDLNGISATVQSDHTTLGQHTTKIGQLEVTTGGISQRVTVIEGDYVKNAQILLMVTKNAQGYISNALIDADDIDFVFTDAVSWYWQSKAEANKRMGLDSNGDLWISGQYRGGTITDNVVVGTSGGEMEIYSDEVVTGSLKKSGLRGVVNSNTVLDLGFTRLNSELSPYFMMHGTAPFIAQPVTMTMHPYSMSIGIDSGNAIRFGIGPTGKIEISGSWPSAWPSRDEVGVGDVFVGNDEILRVRLS
jgi:hypothetical protein